MKSGHDLCTGAGASLSVINNTIPPIMCDVWQSGDYHVLSHRSGQYHALTAATAVILTVANIINTQDAMLLLLLLLLLILIHSSVGSTFTT